MAEAKHYDGDEIQVFTGTVTGTFATIIPAVPGEGQTWDTTALYTKGILKVSGGDSKPDDQSGTDPQPAGNTQKCCLAWGNMSRTGGDNACTELVGVEAAPSNNIGFSMKYTTVTDKYYSKGSKMTYDFDGTQRTGITCSNGAQNSIFLPEGAKVTKITFWSIVGNNSSSRTSYWKEVAGKTYTEADGQLFDLNAIASAPNKAEFILDNVERELTFTNSGEQQSIVIVMEFHYGGTTGISTYKTIGTAQKVEYYTLKGERIANLGSGLYIMRATMPDGSIISRKIAR